MRLFIYVEIHLERNLQFQSVSEDLLLFKNSIKNENVIELDNFSEDDYLNLIIKSFDASKEIILIVNQLDVNAGLGSFTKLLRKLKSHKNCLTVFSINCRLPKVYKQQDFESMQELSEKLVALHVD